MAAETGKRLECAELGAQYMITKGGDAELSCLPAADGESDQLGKRYQDETTGIMVLCTKAGSSRIHCDGRPMAMLAARKLPSSD